MKSLRALIIALLVPVAAWSQVTYSLPSTVVTVEVTTVKESYVAGPYARFAQPFLGIDVPMTDYCITTITEVKAGTSLVADLSSTYTLSKWNKNDKFLALTSQGLVAFQEKDDARKNTWFVVPATGQEGAVLYNAKASESEIMAAPIPWEVDPAKSVEELAKDAAEIILAARRERYNISIGNTDATFSGEALGHALDELKRLEDEYLPLFVGTKTVEEQHGVYTICPSQARMEHHYPVFAISDTEGLVSPGNDDDEVYYLDIYVSPSAFPGIIPAAPENNKPVIHYRIPVLCAVKLASEHQVLFNTQYPVYQLGREETLPVK